MGQAWSDNVVYLDSGVDLTHFELQRAIGQGSFGRVRVVMKKSDQKLFALKYISKAQTISRDVVNNVVNERRILAGINYPLCPQLRYAFQDDRHLFLVMNLMPGGDLRFHIGRRAMTEEQVRGYVAEIGCTLGFLNARRIVHRNLKPDNILLDEKGHAHICDFVLSARFKHDKPMKTTAGSTNYMAPEMLKRKGYFAGSVDWWSLGVIMYEMMFKVRPFEDQQKEALIEKVVMCRYEIPERESNVFSKDAIDLLKKLLVVDPNERIGTNAARFEEFKNHPWFKFTLNGYEAVNFAELPEKKWTPPFVPNPSEINFDVSHEVREELDNNNPLDAGRKKSTRMDPARLPGGADGKYADALEKLENGFRDFNYELEAPGQQHAEDAIAPSGLSLFSIANASSFSIARFNPFGRAQKPSATPKHKPIVEEEEEDSDAGKLEHELDSYVKEELAQAKKSKSVDGAVAKEDASKQKTVRTMVME